MTSASNPLDQIVFVVDPREHAIHHMTVWKAANCFNLLPVIRHSNGALQNEYGLKPSENPRLWWVVRRSKDTSDCAVVRNFTTKERATQYLQKLLAEYAWNHPEVRLFSSHENAADELRRIKETII